MPLIASLGELFAVIVRAILPPLVKLLNDVLIPIILWLADILVTYFVPYWTKLAEVMGGIVTVAVDIVTRVFKGLMKILEPVWNAVKPLIEGFMSLMGLKPVKLSVGIKTTGTSALPGLATGKGIDLSKFTGVSTGGGLKGGGGGDAKTVAANNKAIKAALAKAGKAVKTAYAKYNKAVESAQADFAKAKVKIDKQYNDTVANLTMTRDTDLDKALKDHNANVLAIQKDFANRMADIVQESKNRLRSAFESVTAVDVGKTFADLATKNADGLISSLKEKLLRARELVANAGKLASAGFSQTFIEQVVAQGPDAGNAMAKAILESSPDAQAEIQGLFIDSEKLAGHGMDALADLMYEKSGLANEALRDMYAQASKDLVEALAIEEEAYALRQTEIQKTFDEGMVAAKLARDEAMAEAQAALTEALAEATKNLNESLKDIETELNASLKEFKGQLKGHAKEIASIKSDIADARAEAMKPIVITRIENVVVNTSYGSSKNNKIALAAGGLVTRPTEALIGEAGPELVMPLDDFAKLTGRDGNGSTVNYYAAPNQSLNAEQALFQAMKRAKVVAAW
jgi:F0F1-type ATP synthase membrane subunit b/b'